VLAEIRRLGYRPHVMRGVERIVIGAIGDERKNPSLDSLRAWAAVESVTPVQKRHKLVSREAHPKSSTVKVGDVEIGGSEIIVMAGPCSVEGETQLLTTAEAVAKAGARILRGGAFKPRTSPYEFQGLGEKGLKMLSKARKRTGLKIVTELLSEDHVDPETGGARLRRAAPENETGPNRLVRTLAPPLAGGSVKMRSSGPTVRDGSCAATAGSPPSRSSCP
jgi:3-deoxy-7-phosphoheptulonate synthase